MADAIKFTLDGFSQLEAALKDLGPKVARTIGHRGMKAGAQVIVAAAQGRVPVSKENEPHLRDSIVATNPRVESESKLALQIGFTKPASRHAGFVEFGTAKMAARPFMRPAIDADGQTAIDVMGDQIGEDIETAAKGYPLGKAGV